MKSPDGVALEVVRDGEDFARNEVRVRVEFANRHLTQAEVDALFADWYGPPPCATN